MKKTTLILCTAILGLSVMPACQGVSGSGAGTDPERFEIQEPAFPDRVFTITEFGALSGGDQLNTEAIRMAIETCNEEGGGHVVVPPGVWLTGPIQLMDNVDLHLEEGSVLLFSDNFDDYPYVLSYFEGRRDFRAMPLVYGDSVHNIAITGKGALDGSGQAWRPLKKDKCTEGQWNEVVQSGGVLDESGRVWWPNEQAYMVSRDPNKYREILWDLPDRDAYKAFYRPPLVQLVSCTRVLLEGPLFQNSPGWCIHPLMCEHLTVRDVMVRNPWYAQNGDGIDVESCSYVSIKDSHFDVGDDAICLKSGKDAEGRKLGKPTQYMVVENCMVHHGHGGFVVGSEMSGGVKDIWVSNCTFLGTDVGLRFKSTRGRGGVVENIHIENIRMINIDRDAIIFNLFYAGLAPTEMGEDPIEGLISHAPEVSEETPEFRNITMRNIDCQGAFRAVQILGLPEMPVENLTIENSVFRSERGIECLFGSQLNLKNVNVTTEGNPAIKLVNVSGATIDSLTGNSEILYHLDGTRTSGVVIRSDTPDQVMQHVELTPQVAPEVIRVE